MSYFFQPNSKVQKDRHIMRETDSRMAKYSRRGLVFNFIAFLVCLIGGRFVDENKELTLILASGLLLVTVLRGYCLFRFDQLYPRGPMRWRNMYFVVTLIGAIWWGAILASITLVLGLNDETPLLWLYTVVFFSTTAHAFAPYHRFLSIYQFCGLIPAAAAATYVGEWSGHIYGAVMLMFYLILSHQCRLISDNYWEKLEAGYALSKRSGKEEQERSTSQTDLILSKEFVENLDSKLARIIDSDEDQSNDIRTALKEVQKKLRLFKKIQTRQLDTNSRVFNIRHELQSIISEFIELAESKKVHVETSLSTNLPMRLKGDPVRFAQIVRTIIRHSLEECASSSIIVEAQFLREYEAAGELHIVLKRENRKPAATAFFTEVVKSDPPKSIELSIAKGLAELFGGELEIIEISDGRYEIRFNCRLDIVDRAGYLDFHKGRFNGNRILFVSSSASVAALKRQELDALGFTTSTETQFKKVTSTLIHTIKSGHAIEYVLIYHDPNSPACEQVLEDLRTLDELKGLNKIVAASDASQLILKDRGLVEHCGFYYVSKPLGLFELESTFDYMYSAKGDEASLRLCRSGTVIIVEDESESSLSLNCELLPNQRVLKVKPDKLERTLLEVFNIMVVVPCKARANPAEILDIIRRFESNHDAADIFIPVIGVGEQGCGLKGISAFEIGFDDYIDMESARAQTLTSTLRYWRSVAQ